MCDTFKISFAKPAEWSFTGLINIILHWISSDNLFLCSTKEPFGLPFHLSFPQPLPLFTFIVAFGFPHKLTSSAFPRDSFIGFPSFLSCSHWQCAFPSRVQLLQSWLGPPYSVLHTLLDCISPPQHSPRNLSDLFVHHFLKCRVCLHMTLGGVPYLWWWVFLSSYPVVEVLPLSIVLWQLHIGLLRQPRY